jgi:hypothetical protein
MDKIVENTETDLNEILRIRREKLEALKQEGRNPFDITRFDREQIQEQDRIQPDSGMSVLCQTVLGDMHTE